MRVPRALPVLVALVSILGLTGAQCVPVQRCNGYRALCNRPFDQVAYATTHNAMSNADDGFVGVNQEYSVTRQLDDGIRGLMLDTHYNGPSLPADDAPNGVPLLCHGYCTYGWRLLTDTLTEIKVWLDAHPNDVVTIIFESYITRADTATAFASSGLDLYVTDHVAGAPWPTLSEMIAANDRIVVMTDSGGGVLPWYLDVWDEAFENPYSAKTPDDLVCDVNRGNAANSLFIKNHFLTDPVARRTLADQVNFNPFFLEEAQLCQTERGHIPNFVTVDFYDRGDLLSVVRTLNGV